MGILARTFLVMTFICICNAENVDCPSCKYVGHDGAPTDSKNEACLPSEYNEDHPDLAITSCKTTDDLVAKCVSFSGNLTADVENVGNQTVTVYIRTCVRKDSDQGNTCEDLSGTYEGEPDFLGSILDFLDIIPTSDEYISGQLCYSDGSTSSGVSLKFGLLALTMQFSLVYLIMAP
ncbi:uncharacterized protein [Ptychodera flava]|uniref:uncharacterized protein isoform X2 n=1 Tax=Ptychodera flava TaxID=63121 RepID=UPI003969C5C6